MPRELLLMVNVMPDSVFPTTLFNIANRFLFPHPTISFTAPLSTKSLDSVTTEVEFLVEAVPKPSRSFCTPSICSCKVVIFPSATPTLCGSVPIAPLTNGLIPPAVATELSLS